MLDREVVHVDTESDVETKENHLSDRVTTSSPSSSGDDAVVRPERDTVALKVDESVDVWKHKKLHTVHLALKGCKLSFLCGRKIGQQHERTTGHQRFDVSQCRQCFRSRALEHEQG